MVGMVSPSMVCKKGAHWRDVNLKRAERKRLDRERLMTVPRAAKVVKLIDRIDNLREIDPSDGFAELYANEKGAHCATQ